MPRSDDGRWQDRLIMGISLIGYSLPSFFIGLVLIFFVIIKWQLAAVPLVRARRSRTRSSSCRR